MTLWPPQIRSSCKRFTLHQLASALLLLVALIWSVWAQANEPAGLVEMRALAKNLVETGLYDQAVEAHREIIRFTPNQAQSHYDLAATLTFLRLYDEAIEPISAAERLDPRDPRYPKLAALIFFALKHHSDAANASRRGAELGDIQAMFTLSGMYQRGLGVPVDHAQAMHWTLQAAEGGHLGAMDFVIQIYTEGLLGQDKDLELAEIWRQRLRKAEAQ